MSTWKPYGVNRLTGVTDTLEVPVEPKGFYVISVHGTGFGSVDCNYKDSVSGDEGNVLDPVDGSTPLAFTGNRGVEFLAPEDTLVFDLTGGTDADIEVKVRFLGFRK